MKSLQGECTTCESSFILSFERELVADDEPSFCPFCGSILDSMLEEYIDEDDSSDD